MARGRCELDSCALLHRARSDTRCVLRAYTCVNSVKLRTRMRFIEDSTEGSQDRMHGKTNDNGNAMSPKKTLNFKDTRHTISAPLAVSKNISIF